MITVLIPTTDRPAMLRQALRSVRAQTARDAIARIIVSENAAGRGSEEVCAQFADLPVEYLRQDPPTSSFEHSLRLLARLPEQGYAAILHDDDWWAAGHLRAALDALEADPECAAYFANHFAVAGESAPLDLNPYSACWYASGFRRLDETWRLDARAVVLACLPVTPCHYSTLVCGARQLKACSSVYSTGNPFDTDRLLVLALSRAGPIAYNCIPDTFVRMHAAQDGRAFAWEEQVRWMSSTTERVIAQAGELGIDLGAALVELYASCPAGFRATLQMYFELAWCAPVLRRHRLPMPPFGAAPPDWKSRARRWIPPAMLELWSRRGRR